MSVLIKGGRVITAADDYVADVFIEDERITLIGESLDLQADKVIDASGKYLLPGLVDPHTHLEMPWRGETTVDDFQSGHTAAAFGGTTTHVDFCIQGKGQTFGEALEAWHAKREGKALIDNGFHIAVTDLREGGTLEELAELPEKHGVTSYKLFMAYKDSLMVDDETLFRTMQVAAETGALVMVHAENGDAIEVLVAEALAAGNTDPIYHALTRPPETEGEATNRAIQLARVAGAALYVVHVSCAESVEPLAIAREKGWNVHGETCTQYFFIDQTFLERPNFEGAKYVYTPPPRDKANQEVLWNAVRTDILSAISTDHCAYLFDGQKDAGKDDFSQIPNGGPGLENRLHMIHEFGVRTGKISLNRMVELLATNPAKLFGLYPRKGTLAVGSDADVVVFDPNKELTISAATHHSASDYNLYEGTKVTGSPEVVLLRGNVLVENGELVAKPGTRPVHQAREVRRRAEARRARGGQRLIRSPYEALALALLDGALGAAVLVFAVSAAGARDALTHFAVYVVVIGFFKIRDALKRLPALIAQAKAGGTLAVPGPSLGEDGAPPGRLRPVDAVTAHGDPRRLRRRLRALRLGRRRPVRRRDPDHARGRQRGLRAGGARRSRG